MQFAKPLGKIYPYLFAEINRKREELVAKGVDVINIGVGDPDRPTLAHIVQAMHEAINDPSNYNNPPYQGTEQYRKAAVEWIERRFGVKGLDPDQEIVSSIGAKEAIHKTFLAFVEPGDYTLIPDPGYPVYRTSTIFEGGEPYLSGYQSLKAISLQNLLPCCWINVASSFLPVTAMEPQGKAFSGLL